MKNLLTQRVVSKYPRLRQRVVKLPYENFYFEENNNFDINNHLKISELKPIPGSTEVNENQILDRLGELYSDSNVLDKNFSPWFYEYVKDFEGNKSALLYKFHHVLSDGVGLLGTLMHIV